MSQPPMYPPPPGNYPPPPGSYPPPGAYPPGFPMPGARRTSAAAIVSLIFGILGCIPFVGSTVAIRCGIIGFKAAGRPDVKGRGLAVTGIILGLIWLVLY